MGARRFWSLLHRRRLERDIQDELAAHVALREQSCRAGGAGPAAAAREAQRRLGSDLSLRERIRAEDIPLGLEELLRDIATAGRMLRRRPGFTLLAIATLALGIGAATAMYSVVRTVVLDPLPFPDGSRLVQVKAVEANIPGETGRSPDGMDPLVRPAVAPALRKADIFASMGTITWMVGPAYIHGYATSGLIFQASADLFPTLGVQPVLGRGFSGHGNEAMVGYGFFRKELHGQASAVGQSVRIKDQSYTIVGVLGSGDLYPQGRQTDTSIWVESPPPPAGCKGNCEVVGRLRSDLPMPAARARAEAAVAALGKHIKMGTYFSGLAVTPLEPAKGPDRALWVLFAAAACLLLIACGNTANLLLARGLERERELAVRRALGASRARLARLLLAEGAWLALAGGVAGVALAWGLVRLARLGPASIPRLAAVRLNAPVLLVAAGLAVACGLICALAPALRFSRHGGAGLDAIHSGDQVTHAQGLRRLLVAAEVALTLALLIGGALLVRTFMAMENVNLGFNPHQVTTIGIWFPRRTSYPQTRSDWNKLVAHEAQVEQAVRARAQALPGVSAAGYSMWQPLGTPNYNAKVSLPSQPKAQIPVFSPNIGAGYFHALGIPLLAGRNFSPAELEMASISPFPVIINAALARRLWPARAPQLALGARLQPDPNPKDTQVVVGVVGNIRNAPGKPPLPTLYLPVGSSLFSWTLYLRSPLPPAELGREVHDVLASVDPSLTMSAPAALEDKLTGLLEQPRYRALLLAAFAALAWSLALVGLYGVLAFSVRQRRREIGIRVAFGAGHGDVLRLILRQSVAVLAAGIAAGWLLSWFLSRYIHTLLYGVGALDAATWLGAGAALAAAGLLASYLPARRALRVDPADTLRCE